MPQTITRVARDVHPGALPLDVRARVVAAPSCHTCAGSGVVVRRRAPHACRCVFRAVFRACLACYENCQASVGSRGVAAFERVGHAQGRCAIVASFKRAEYSADFILTARRALAEHPLEWAVIRESALAGRAWRDTVHVVNRDLHPSPLLDRAGYYYCVRRAEELIGREILAASPYRLYPIRDYFAGFYVSAAELIQPRVRK